MYTKLVISSFIQAISRIRIRLFLLLIIVGGQLTSQAQLRYNFERINTESGLPTNAIKGLQFDEKTRFLWVATESGIVRYNGYGFQSFGDDSKTVALNGRIVYFDKTQNGKLYGKLMDERVFFIQENKAVIDPEIQKLDGEINNLNYKYSLTSERSKLRFFEVENKDFIFRKNIYTKIDHTLFVYKTNQLNLISDSVEYDTEFIIRDKLFVLLNNGKVQQIDFKQNKLYVIKQFILINQDKSYTKNIFLKARIYQNHPEEPVYLVSGSKLYLVDFKNNVLALNLITDQLPSKEFIKYIQIDKITNTIYLGTDNRGLIVGRPKYFNRILPNNVIDGVSTSAYAQLQLSNGNVQINSGQVFGISKKPAPKIFYRPSESGTFITKDSILFMTNSDGIVEYDLRKNKFNEISKEVLVNRSCFIEVDNKIYAFNEKGVALKNKAWDYIVQFKNMPFNFIVYSLYKINDNEILAATTHGLYKYNLRQNTFKLYYKEKDNANFRTIYNLNGYFLIGTYGGGVYMYHNDSIRKLPLDQNKYLNYAHCFIQDQNGNVWASTNKGLFMSPYQSLIDYWEKGPGNIKFQYFGKSEGIDELEMNGGCSPCAIKLKNGNLSFPGIDGLIQFNPDSIPNVNIQPKVYLDKVIIDGTIVNPNMLKSDFSSKVKNVEIQMGISGMLSQENIMMEYKLDNDPWVRVNVKNSIIKYSNPEFGAHTISIRLRNTINSNWEQVVYPFTINYPWTMNPYMYVFYFLLIIGLVLLYIRFKTLIYQRREKLLQTEVNAKTASLNKLNETLIKRNQAKDQVIAIMNHDILTPLKYLHITAKNIADTTKEDKVRTSINQIAKTSKELEYLTSNMLNWVKFESIETFPQKQDVNLHALVKDLVGFVEPLKLNDDLTIINSIPEDLIIQNWPDSLRVLLYNLIINGINNTPKGEILITYDTIQNGYRISVSDTGVGMNASMIQHLLKGKSKDEVEQIPKLKKGNGVGFQIIRNIIHLMNAQIEISSLEQKGTIVCISFMD